MASKDEKLCMAIIRNSVVEKINWDAVAKDMGMSGAHAARCQWTRTKKKLNEDAPSTPSKSTAGRKRGMKEMSDGEEEKVVRKEPAKKKGRGKKVKMETPELTSEDEVWNEGLDEEEV